MSNTIPFVEARFFSANEGRVELEVRLKKHLRRLRCRRLPPNLLARPAMQRTPMTSRRPI